MEIHTTVQNVYAAVPLQEPHKPPRWDSRCFGMMNSRLIARGTAQIGLDKGWPLNASLYAGGVELRLRVAGIFRSSEYVFTPHDIVEIRPITWLPFLAWGIRICFARGVRLLPHLPTVPCQITVWTLENPKKVAKRIRDAGFRYEAEEML